MSLLSAFNDPLFALCLHRAASSPALVGRFESATGRSLAAATAAEAAPCWSDDVLRFAQFVHDEVYLKVAPAAGAELRAAMAPPVESVSSRSVPMES